MTDERFTLHVAADGRIARVEFGADFGPDDVRALGSAHRALEEAADAREAEALRATA